MPISRYTLEYWSERSPQERSKSDVDRAFREARQTAFLSHSHKDADLAKGVQAFLRSRGWSIYIDWEDNSMPDTPTGETASKIKERIKQLDWFLYLATANSSRSRWCPWEIGYADGVKKHERILLLPTRDVSGTYGNEYLQLYRRIDEPNKDGYRVIKPGHKYFGTPLKELSR